MDTPVPLRVSQLGLPGLNGGDYAPTAWWVFWQGGRYAYVAGTSAGLYILDVSDPAAPVVVANRTPSQLGFGANAINTVFAVGNLLVLTGSQPSEAEPITGLATYDISDPANPVLLDFENDLVGYSAMVNGDRVLGARDPARIWNIADPANIAPAVVGPDVAAKGGYGLVQDNFFHYGSSSRYVKLNLATLTATTSAPTGFTNPDWDFATPLANVTFQGNDHSGSALVVHQLTPDTTRPAVNMVSPKPDTVNRALTSRVGLTFTDQIDLRTVDATTFMVRPVGGSALPGRYSHQTGIVNFWPDAALAAKTTYEIRLPAGGVRDHAGNGLAAEFVSQFSTGASINGLTVQAQTSGPVVPGAAASFTATGAGQGTLLYSWNFGDGTAATPFSANPNATHAYAAPGHYAVSVTLNNGTSTAAASLTQTVHRPLAAGTAAASGTILFDAATSRVWCVNPDADTVTALDAVGLTKLFETPVGNNPRTLARAPGGAIWVVNQDDATISVLHPTTGAVTGLIPLPRAARPYGLAFSPDGSAAWVSTEGTGELLKLNPTTGAVLATQPLGAPVRGVAITADSARVFVTRFLSPDARGEVFELHPATLALVRTLTLAPDAGPDTEASGRGLPNYLTAATISPDGQRLWLPGKKDNLARGLARDGLPLTFESTVRTIVAQLDLGTNAEPAGTRVDLNDRDLAQAVAFSPLGDYAFVAAQGSNAINILDAYTGGLVGGVENVGRAPQGLVFNAAGTRLFVQNFMSRNVAVFDTAGFVSATTTTAPPLATISTVAVEPLSPTVLLGKQLFYNADDPRMNHDGYLSCASCHLDAGHDGRIWDFTDRGEGLRRTPSLHGRAGLGQGRVHWSANFDEIQDFEHDIRGPFDGDGFLTDAQFNAGTRNQPLGDPKAGVSADLDALAAYLTSLAAVPASPFRQADGALTPDAVAGRALFVELACFACHADSTFTDSRRALLHDVGTLKPSSGQRLGGPLPGLDTPTLRGAWQAGRYLHDGSAATLLDVLTTANPSGLHGATLSLTATQRQQLAAYLGQIDESETSPTIGAAATLVSPAPGGAYAAGATVNVAAAVSDGAGAVSLVQFFRNGVLLAQDDAAPFETSWPSATAGPQVFGAKISFASGLTTTTDDHTIVVGGSPATTPVRINFQTAAAPVPAGYLADSGEAFGNRGNGYSYGWSGDCTAGSRDRDLHADQRYDTLCHMRLNSNAAAFWEIALPNGIYDIFVVFGDARFTDQVDNINIEGGTVTDTTNANFNEHTIQRTVSDGRLTLAHGAGASNPKICFIDITPVPTASVSIAALTPAAAESGPVQGAFRISRTGDLTAALPVQLVVGGSAENGPDYSAISSAQQIPAGASSLDLPVTPVDDAVAEGSESVVLTLAAGSGYLAGPATSATVSIADAPLDAWKRAAFTAPQRVTPTISGNLADPNRNGLVNLLEYALARDPWASGAPAPVSPGRDQSGRLTLTFLRPVSATDITYFVEGAAILGTPWLSDPAHLAIALTPGPGGLLETVTATWLGNDASAFLRLRVEP